MGTWGRGSVLVRILAVLRSSGRKRMVQRTCLDCGETWPLEASLARLRARRPHGYAAGLRTAVASATKTDGSPRERKTLRLGLRAETAETFY
jgi:hypothetical protein